MPINTGQQFNTATKTWTALSGGLLRAATRHQSVIAAASPVASDSQAQITLSVVAPPCAGCGGEKFTATTPSQIEAVLREHANDN